MGSDTRQMMSRMASTEPWPVARGQWDSMEQSVGLLPMDTGQPGNTDNTGYASDTGDSRNIGDMLDQWTRS